MGTFGEVSKLHFFLFPFMAHGHMIPTLDMAKLFATKGAKSTILTTPLNSKLFEKPINTFNHENPNLEDITIEILNFPCSELGLPNGCENTDFIFSNPNLSRGSDLDGKFLLAMKFFEEPLEKLMEAMKPDCLVGNMFFPWATKVAEKLGIPRLVFHGTGYFSLCASHCIRLHKPYKKVSSSSEPFVIPDLPGEVVISEEQVIEKEEESVMGKFMKEIRETERNSFGVLVNSFYELEPAYSDFFKSFVAKRAWNIGPLSLGNRGFQEKAVRGKKASIDEHECLKWLDSKRHDSVIYLSFGTMTNFTNEQLTEIAAGLEMSGHAFVWVVNKLESQGEKEEWLPEGFRERTKGKGLIICGWAPQVLILDHKAIGGFVTHCGWNSILEGVASGLPMVTWPVGAEQFYNEKLVTQVLKIGVSVGVKKMVKAIGDFISREKVERAVKEVMVGEERRKRAKELAELAKDAVKEGGSSDIELDRLMQELKLVKSQREKEKGFEEKAERGKKPSIDEVECLKWLDSKEPDSVIYISFGSKASFKNEKLTEIAQGLVASDASFIWVVRANGRDEEWLPEGFEERVKGKGLIIRGWAPQVLILDHQATGGFVTHCGWNSILEGVAAGVSLVAWPVESEQFYNEKSVTQVLRIGVKVGLRMHASVTKGDFVSREEVDRAVREVMDGEEAEERRKRAKQLAVKAKAAVEEGGSSFNNLNSFIQEFSS